MKTVDSLENIQLDNEKVDSLENIQLDNENS